MLTIIVHHIFQIVFNIEIAIGSSPKAVAFKSATKLRATWLILDRLDQIKLIKIYTKLQTIYNLISMKNAPWSQENEE
jgi:hypothetical protein